MNLRDVAAPAGGLLLAGLVALLPACRREPSRAEAARRPEAYPAGTPLLAYERLVGGNLDLYLVPAAGGAPQRLTRHPAADGRPRWSADGRSLVFASDRSGREQLWELSLDGRPARRLRANDAREWEADPAPDGRHVVFMSDLGGPASLWLLDRVTGRARRLLDHGPRAVMGSPSFSPDGRRIAFSSNWRLSHQIYVWEEGSARGERISPAAHGGCAPRFGPQGLKIVYVSRRRSQQTSSIVEHDLRSGRERILVDWPAYNYDPVLSPDGSELAFASNVTGEYEIYRLRLSDGRAWRVTFGEGPAAVPAYRPPTRD